MDTEKTPDKSTGRQVLVVVGVLGAIAVNIAAFMLSADAINAVAVAAGISKRISWAMVAAVDGLMVTGTVVFIANKLRGRSVVYPLCVLAAGVLLSIICNALHAKAGGGHVIQLDSKAKMAVSAIPAVSLALSFHLIADMVKDSLGLTEKASAEAPIAAPAAPPVQAPVGAPVAPPVGRLSERLPDASQAPAEAPAAPPVKAPGSAPVGRPKQARTTAAKKSSKATKLTADEARAKAWELLKKNPDMSAPALAVELGKSPTSGHVRDMKAKLLQELRDAGELQSVRAVGA